MSHDIRTPMNAIVGFTELACSHVDDSEKVKDYLGRISVSSQHLLSLINDVLDMSRIESGNVTIEETDVHLPDVIHDMKTIVEPSAAAKKQKLTVDMQEIATPLDTPVKVRYSRLFMTSWASSQKEATISSRRKTLGNL